MTFLRLDDPEQLCLQIMIVCEQLRWAFPCDATVNQNDRPVDDSQDLLDMMFAYVRDLKRENGFKQRTPYLL